MEIICINNESSVLKEINVGDKFKINKKIIKGKYIYDYIETSLGILEIDRENYYFKKSFRYI